MIPKPLGVKRLSGLPYYLLELNKSCDVWVGKIACVCLEGTVDIVKIAGCIRAQFRTTLYSYPDCRGAADRQPKIRD